MKTRPLDGSSRLTSTQPTLNTPAMQPAAVEVTPSKPDAFGGERPASELDRAEAPSAVKPTFSAPERAELQKKIPCPALASMFTAGMLNPDKDGNVKIPELEKALSQLGPSATVRKVLTGGADKTDAVEGSFNLFKLNGSNLDHTGSTGIRQNGIHENRFDVLKSFSKDGERLTAKDLADAAEHFAKEDPGLRGRVTQLAEMSIVLQVFGRQGADGKQYFTIEDARNLFVEGRFPASWSPPVTPGKVGLGDVLGATAMGLFRQLVNGK